MQIHVTASSISQKTVKFLTLGEIAEIKEGLGTADNKSYLYKEPEANGNYRIIDRNFLLRKEELEKINQNEDLRKKIIEHGILEDLFEGRTVVPYDKGGSSDIESGRLSNYYFPTQFYIDWSSKMVNRMKTLTIADRKRLEGKTFSEEDETQIAAVFRNTDYYFKPGLTIPMAGIYSPTFKINSCSIFDHGGNCIFVKGNFKKIFSFEYLLGILCSKITRYFLKNFINNSVNTPPDAFKPLPIPIIDKTGRKKIEELVGQIISKQKNNLNYNYQNFEQIDIDHIVYEIFGLDNDLIDEIENWYARKYPKLIKNS